MYIATPMFTLQAEACKKPGLHSVWRAVPRGTRAPARKRKPFGLLRAPHARVGRRCAPPRRFAPLLKI